MGSKADSTAARSPRGKLRWRVWTGLRAKDSLAAFRLVRQGLRYKRIETFHQASGLSMDTIARAADISRRTLSRRRTQGRLRPDESDRLLRLSRLFDQIGRAHV